MAYEPIVLTSNLIPGGNQNIGALANVYSNPDPVRRDPTIENDDGTFTIPTYRRELIDIPDDFDWSMYGRAGPSLRFFNQVRTGEITYDPAKDKAKLDDLTNPDPNAPPLTTEAEMIKQELLSTAKQFAIGAGAQIGRALAADPSAGFSSAVNAYTSNISNPLDVITLGYKGGAGKTAIVDASEGTKRFDMANRGVSPLTDSQTNALTARNTDLEKIIGAERGEASATERLNAEKELARNNNKLATIEGAGGTGYFSGVSDRLGFGAEKGMSQAGKANLYGSGGAALASVAVNLISGKNLKESVKTGVKVGAGTFVGRAIGGPVGALIGGLLGGRVICNELMRQGIMTRKQVVLDYKFTQDYLTPQHVAGYHVWAVWMVRQMRKGRLVNLWKHVAGHRANEIAYIYGERDKPDYLGKVYRKILEPICWSIGFFCQKTDWTVLYKEKEV